MDDGLASECLLICTMKQPDVVVVGAGPAGSSAAIHLARAGYAVTVCESANFPRRKVCGGCLSGDAVELLDDLFGDQLMSLGTPVERITFSIGCRKFRACGDQRCRIVRRDILDAALAATAEAAGARLEFRVRAELHEEGRGRFLIRAGAQQLQPRWIIWAAGLTDLVRHEQLKPTTCRRALIGQAWSVAPTEACPPVGEVAMHWLRGGYVGLATVAPEECLVGLAVERRAAAGTKTWEALRSANSNASILHIMDLSTVAPKLGTASFPHRPKRLGYGNVLVAGDAAGFEEPFSGEGIGQALRSGMAAAHAVLTGENNESVLRHYRQQLRYHRRVRRRTRWMSRVLRSNVVHTLADSRFPGLDALGGHLLRGVHIKPTTERV
jgi:flavin-dependent dehydrogenase